MAKRASHAFAESVDRLAQMTQLTPSHALVCSRMFLHAARAALFHGLLDTADLRTITKSKPLPTPCELLLENTAPTRNAAITEIARFPSFFKKSAIKLTWFRNWAN